MRDTATKTKYFIYVRKSSESEDRQVQSIPDQIDRLSKLVDSDDMEIVDTIQEAHSAKSPGTRPEFNRMLERIESGEANGILCWEMNRLSRNPVDSGRIHWLLQEGVIKSIKTISREHRPDDNALLWSVESGSANQFIVDLKKGVRRGLDSKLEKGDAPIMAPIGYKNSIIEIRGENKILVDSERFPIVRKIWDLMLTGNYTPPQILELADKEWGLRTRKTKRKGGKPISRSTIYRILTDPFYTGLFRYRGKTYQGNHQPMITLDEFDRVQYLLGREGKPRPKTHAFAFTGIITCGECGSYITAIEKTKLNKATNELRTYVYYYCTRRKTGTGKNCTQRTYTSVEALEEQIESELLQLAILPEFKDWALEVLQENHGQEIEERTKLYESQTSALLEAQKQLDKLVDMYIRELIGEADYKERRAKLQDYVAEQTLRLKETQQRAANWIQLTEQVFNFACYARIAFANGDLQTKKEILTALGQNYSLTDGKLTILLNSWLIPIVEQLPSIEAEYNRLEPTGNRLDKRQKEAFASPCLLVRGRRDLNSQPPA